jgi:putative YhdH/YhfP family quinone oxidoreductase
MKTYKALVVEETKDNKFTTSIKELPIDSLPAGDVLVRVEYSSLNYKDALSASGNRGVTRNYPHTPGIDAAGVIEESTHKDFKAGDKVIVTSYDLGMNTAGGFGQYICVPANWVVQLPEGLSMEESMIYGTAGFTAGMSVFEITQSLVPESGNILVSGATGGVGSMAVAILAKLGYHVIAVSGKPEAEKFLKKLYASKVISREQILENKDRPLLKTQWAGVVDTVGGEILANAIKATSPLGIITACGNVASPDIPITVFPFILRGVSLIGIDSQNCPMAHRANIWKQLAGSWKPDKLSEISTQCTLKDLPSYFSKILQGKISGRVVLKLWE